MKRIVIFLGAMVWIVTAPAQVADKPLPHSLTLAVKGVLEKRLSGSDIRGRTDSFLIGKDSLSRLYTFNSDVNELLPPMTLSELNSELNVLLTEQTDEGLAGEVFFDTHLDSVVVRVQPAANTDNIFVSGSRIPEPGDGMESFSKRLHDYLRGEIAAGRISQKTFADIRHIGVLVTNFGYSVKGPKSERLGSILDSFWVAESRSQNWTMGIWSGYTADVKVDVNVFPEYLSGKSPWPEPPTEWAVTHVIASFKNGRQQDPYIYCTERYASAFKPYTMVSMVYDPMLQTYRMPCIHAGSVEKCQRLVEDVKRQVKNTPDGYEKTGRIYFYRE